jgi:transcriptional regulator NrdR family protein
MKCPYCKSESLRVIDTRKYDTCILRVRLCLACDSIIKTHEEIELQTPVLVKITPVLPK